MTDLARRFAKHLAGLGLRPGPAIVAVSGGPDSLALLYLLHETRADLQLVVAHVDHGIHPDSATVTRAVRTTAASLELPFEMTALDLGAGTSETRAREAR